MGHASLGHAAQRQAAPGIATYRHILAYRRFGRPPAPGGLYMLVFHTHNVM